MKARQRRRSQNLHRAADVSVGGAEAVWRGPCAARGGNIDRRAVGLGRGRRRGGERREQHEDAEPETDQHVPEPSRPRRRRLQPE